MILTEADKFQYL